MDWKQIAIPKPLADRIERIMARLGYKSVSDYVTKAVQDRLPREETRYDEIEEALKHGTIKDGGDEGEL